MNLYKYIKKEHARSMMQQGIIRIGTLYDFRKNKRKEIGDKNEGTKTSITHFLEGALIKDKQDWDDKLGHLNGSNINYVQGNIVIPKDARLNRVEDVPDAYIYCASKIYDATLKSKFSDSACIEICNAEKFSKEILKKLVSKGLIYDYMFSDECKYIGHNVDHTTKITAHFLKDPDEYMHQVEYRFVFPPIMKDGDTIIRPDVKIENGKIIEINLPKKEVEIIPQFIKCKEAIKYCRWK